MKSRPMSPHPVDDAKDCLKALQNEMDRLDGFREDLEDAIAPNSEFMSTYHEILDAKFDSCLLRIETLMDEFPSLLIDMEAHLK